MADKFLRWQDIVKRHVDMLDGTFAERVVSVDAVSVTREIIESQYFSRRSEDLSLAAGATLDLMFNTNDKFVVTRSISVATDSTKLQMRYLSNPTHSDDGLKFSFPSTNLEVAHIVQTLKPSGNAVSGTLSQINPTITDVGFEGASFYARASGGAGARQLAALQGNLGLLYPGSTISLRMTNLGGQSCFVDTIFTFSEYSVDDVREILAD